MTLPRNQITKRPKFMPALQEGDHHAVYPHMSTDFPVAGTIDEINIPNTVNSILVQAIDQNIRYSLAGDPSQTSGFRLTADRDPIEIPIAIGRTTIKFSAEVADARLEMQFGT